MIINQKCKVIGNTAIVAFARMNPPTLGHKKLVNKITSLKGDYYLFLSHSHHPKTDPLEFDNKLEIVQLLFPDVIVGNKHIKNIIQVLQRIESLGYQNIVYVAGSDRIDEFTKLINKYNGKEYHFDNITVVSAGDRDPDAAGVNGISASKLREAAFAGNFELFKQGISNKKYAIQIYNAVRNGMEQTKEIS